MAYKKETGCDAVIVPFPNRQPVSPPRICTNCENVFMGTKGLFCGVFREVIVFDTEAEECEWYKP